MFTLNCLFITHFTDEIKMCITRWQVSKIYAQSTPKQINLSAIRAKKIKKVLISIYHNNMKGKAAAAEYKKKLNLNLNNFKQFSSCEKQKMNE